MRGSGLVCAGMAVLFLGAAGSAAPRRAPPVPYIDAHSHIVGGMSADEEVAMLRKAGLAAVAIMHPEPGALGDLAARNPGFVIPFISLARLPQMAGLRLSPDSAQTMADLNSAGKACGFGEIPTRIVPRTEPTDDLGLVNPDRLKIYAEAAKRRLAVNMHVDVANGSVEAAIDYIAKTNRGATFVLAHAGWSAAPERIARLMAANPNVMADLSVRLDPAGGLPQAPLAPGSLPPGAVSVISILGEDGLVRAEWASVLRRFPDRFLFAMDLTEDVRPKHLEVLMATGRKALSAFGLRIEHAIAHGNFERIVAGCRAGLNAPKR